MEMDRDGNVWKVFTADGLDVLMNVRYLKHYGQYYRLDLYIQNNTDRPVKYDFKNTSVASRMGPVKVFRQRGYLNRIGAQKTAKTIGIGIGTLFVTFVMAAIVRGDPDDRDSLAEDLLRDLGGTAIEEAGFIATMAMADSESGTWHGSNGAASATSETTRYGRDTPLRGMPTPNTKRERIPLKSRSR